MIAVIGLSQTVSQEDFDRSKQFVYEFASEFEFGPDESRFGVMSQSAQIRLGESNSISAFKQAVADILLQPGAPNIAQAITRAIEEFASRGRSSNVPKTILLITDERLSDRQATIQAAARARSTGINILVLGIGDAIDTNELNAIATNPDDQYVSLLSDFSTNSFNNIRKPLVQVVCGKS